MASSSHKQRSQCCFDEWMQLQEQDLNELIQVLSPNTINNDHNSDIAYTRLTQKSLQHFEDYMQKRSQLYYEEASSYFAPAWNSSLVNSSLWIGGCRPSIYFRLLYAHTWSNVDSFVAELLRGTADIGSLDGVELARINSLHMKTVKEEDKLSRKLASLQEDVVDQPIPVVANMLGSQIGERNEEVEGKLDEHDAAMANILYDADKLRFDTVKEFLSLLTPKEAVDYLAAAKKVHLNIHEWGRRRDKQHGR